MKCSCLLVGGFPAAQESADGSRDPTKIFYFFLSYRVQAFIIILIMNLALKTIYCRDRPTLAKTQFSIESSMLNVCRKKKTILKMVC